MTRALMNYRLRLTVRRVTKCDVLLGLTLVHAGACATPSEQDPGASTAQSAATTSSGTMGTTGRVEQAGGSGGAPEIGVSPASTGIAGAPDADVPNADAPP